MMLRLSLLLLGLFTYQASAQQLDPWAQCNPCGLVGYYPTVNAQWTQRVGTTTEPMSCSKVQGLARDRRNRDDFCRMVVTNVRTKCQCKNSRGQLAPPLSYRSTTSSCSVRTPSYNKMEYTPPVAVAGLQMKCMFWQRFAGQGAFTSSQCPQVQSLMSRYCYSRRRNLRGDEQEEEIQDQEELDDYDYESDPEYQELLSKLLEMKEEELLFPVDP
mmetsp:Transcript_3058/g.5637  ORF Transcript_3058/g.5637 Transcript_3058/m.5637 type:complete len:215 (-) Transcript_3058:131-775(-)